jgi:EmrB/QacA subfamily drug resistance transporter
MAIKPISSKNIALIVTIAGSFLTPFMGSSLNIALPTIGREFAMEAIWLSWIPTAYLLAAAVFLIPFGRMGDIYGRKKIFTWGIATFTLASFLSALAPSGFFLVLFRLLQGMAGSMIFGTAVAILISIFPAQQRGKVIGLNVASVYLGLSLGPFIGGFLTGHWGWRSIFVLNLLLGILIFAAVRLRLPGEWAGARGERFDLFGSILYGLGLVSTMYGVTILPAIQAGIFIALGMGILAIFIQWERKAPNPMLDVKLFGQNRIFTFSNLAALIDYCSTFGVGFLLSIFLQVAKGFQPWEAGTIMVAQPILQALFSPVAGRLSDRVEPRILASLGMACSFGGLVNLIFLSEETALSRIILSFVFLGFGFGLFSSPNTHAIMSSVDRSMYGVASGVVSTMRLIGQMLSMGIVTLCFAFFLGRVQITPASLPGFLTSSRTAFTAFAILSFLGIFASLARGKIHRSRDHRNS